MILDYEQRYNDALARAKSKIKNDKDHVLYEDDVIEIFPELKESEDERIRKELLAVVNDLVLPSEQQSRFVAWLEKQSNKDEEILFLKNQIESFHAALKAPKEALKIEIEKQDKQNTNILWHDANEEPETYREVLCEWRAKGDINHLTSFHDVAFYHRNDKTFWNGEQQIENVVKWVYVDEMLEKQGKQNVDKVEPKFKAGDWIVSANGLFQPMVK